MLLFCQYSFLLGFVEGNFEDTGHWTKAEPLEDNDAVFKGKEFGRRIEDDDIELVNAEGFTCPGSNMIYDLDSGKVVEIRSAMALENFTMMSDVWRRKGKYGNKKVDRYMYI